MQTIDQTVLIFCENQPNDNWETKASGAIG